MKRFEANDLESFPGRKYVILERFDGPRYTFKVSPYGVIEESYHPKLCGVLRDGALSIARYIDKTVALHCVQFGGPETNHVDDLVDTAVYIEVEIDGEMVVLPYEKADALFNLHNVPHVPMYSGRGVEVTLSDAVLTHDPAISMSRTGFTQQFNPVDRPADGFIAIPWQLTEDEAPDAECYTFDNDVSIVLNTEQLDFYNTAMNMLTTDLIAEVKSEYSAEPNDKLVGLVRDYITQDVQYLTKHVPDVNLTKAVGCIVNFRFNTFMQEQGMRF